MTLLVLECSTQYIVSMKAAVDQQVEQVGSSGSSGQYVEPLWIKACRKVSKCQYNNVT